jgi:hypothetical protein
MKRRILSPFVIPGPSLGSLAIEPGMTKEGMSAQRWAQSNEESKTLVAKGHLRGVSTVSNARCHHTSMTPAAPKGSRRCN